MAGYKDAAKENGQLRSRSEFLQLIDNWGNTYETIEEMYGMIWFLANFIMVNKTLLDDQSPELTKEVVETARRQYQQGIAVSPTDR